MAVTATSLDQLRNAVQVSFYGRRDGFDNQDFEVGPKDLRTATQVIASTVATTIVNYGACVLAATAASSAAYTLQTPVQGVQKQIFQASSSTLGYTLTLPANVNFLSTPTSASHTGSTYTVLTFLGAGNQADLVAVSSALIGVKAGGLAQGITIA